MLIRHSDSNVFIICESWSHFFRVYKISLQLFDKDDQKILIVTTDTLTKFLMENFDSDNGS